VIPKSNPKVNKNESAAASALNLCSPDSSYSLCFPCAETWLRSRLSAADWWVEGFFKAEASPSLARVNLSSVVAQWQRQLKQLELPIKLPITCSQVIGSQNVTATQAGVQAGAQPNGFAALRVLLAESDPVEFLGAAIALSLCGSELIFGNPHWQKCEWQQVQAWICPHLWVKSGRIDVDDSIFNSIVANVQQTFGFSSIHPDFSSNLEMGGATLGAIAIATGGTSGKLRFARHTWDSFIAAAVGLQTYRQQHGESPQIHSFCTLPLHHVSGWMQFVRSFYSGGRFVWGGARLLRPDRQPPKFDPQGFCLSLVPTQLYRLLDETQPYRSAWVEWLQGFETIFLGGAPAWSSLLEEARSLRLRLAPTYGMTETAAQVATLHPEAFLAGRSGCGVVLPHAQIQICDEQGQAVAQGTIGRLQIQARSLFQGYYSEACPSAMALTGTPITSICPTIHTPQNTPQSTPNTQIFSNSSDFSNLSISAELVNSPMVLMTDDLGYIDGFGSLQLVGRSSHKIITGGENVFPSEVEAVILQTGWVTDVCVVGVPDIEWGQAIVAVCVPSLVAAQAMGWSSGELLGEPLGEPLGESLPGQLQERLQGAIVSLLARYKLPKRWIFCDRLPRNAQGKVDRLQVLAQVQTPNFLT